MKNKKQFSTTLTINYLEVEVSGTAVPYTPARINCPIEDSYPAEGGYSEDVCVQLTREVKDKETGKMKTEYLDITDWIPKSNLDELSDEIYNAEVKDEYD